MTERPEIVWPDAMPRDAVVNIITVLNERAGVRLDRFLTVEMPRLSRTRAAKIAERFAFTAGGRQLAPSSIVHPGDVIVLYRPTWNEPEAPRDVPLVHEDETIVAFDKPAGLPVHPTARYHRNTLTAVINDRYPKERVVLCHRLDKDTSGIILAARTVAAETALKQDFAGRRIHKTYRAIVHGRVETDEQVIDAPLALAGGEVSVLMCVRSESEGGMQSRTVVRVVERLAGFTVVDAQPETGRQHQIRVHLAHAGHPIVGDKLYAHGPEPFLASLRNQLTPEMRAQLILERHALHAQRITFEHPATHATMTLETPPPRDLSDFIVARRDAPPPWTDPSAGC